MQITLRLPLSHAPFASFISSTSPIEAILTRSTIVRRQPSQCTPRALSSRQGSTYQQSTSRWLSDDLKRISREESPLIYRSTSTDPYHNLSIEDYILRNSDHSSHILLFYVNRSSVIIGRNQNPWLECNLSRLQEAIQGGASSQERNQTRSEDNQSLRDGNPTTHQIDLVRRRSGGGTVFHDLGNLNYSVIVPNDKDFNRRKHAEMVVRALSNLLDHSLDGSLKVNDRHDIVVHRNNTWLKVSGSAFKLTKGRALHHGTLLFSSPNLSTISDLLRSPGRPYIHAKGVESVRSKVANLKFTHDPSPREKLKEAIIHAIAREFTSMYSCNSNSSSDTTTKEVISVGDEDCAIPKIAEGIQELQTNEWRFGQTPRFDFTSGNFDGSEIAVQVNRGVIEDVKVRSTGSNKKKEEEVSFKPRTDERRIWEIEDWKELVNMDALTDPGQKEIVQKSFGNKDLIQLLSKTFPYAGR